MELLVVLGPEPGTDTEQLDLLGRQLRRELRALDVDDVVFVAPDGAPSGSRGAAAASGTELLVTLSAGGGAIAAVVAVLGDWLGRRAAEHKVSLTVDGDTLELEAATAAERAEPVDTFVRRHQPA